MPYYRCQSCRLLSYSAASHATVGVCAHCDAPLADAEQVESPGIPPVAGNRFTGPGAGATPSREAERAGRR